MSTNCGSELLGVGSSLNSKVDDSPVSGMALRDLDPRSPTSDQNDDNDDELERLIEDDLQYNDF